METRYHHSFGESSSEPKLALHASKKVYDSIKSHLLRKSRIQEVIDKELNHRKDLQDASKAMTDNWENSVENIRKKKEKNRELRLAQKIDDRVVKYHKIIKLQAEDRRKYNEKVARRMFINSQPQKELNSALLLAEAYHENEKQIELKKELEKQAKEDWHKFELQIIQDDMNFKKNSSGEKSIARAKAEENQKLLKEQISEKEKNQKDERNKKIELENDDIKRQVEEMEIIRQNDRNNHIKAKLSQMQSQKESIEERKRLNEKDRLEDEEFTKVCQIFRSTKDKINCTAEKIEKTDLQKTQDMQKAAGQRLQALMSQKRDEEDNRIARALAEREEAENLKIQLQKKLTEKKIQERKSNYEAVLERKRQEKLKETEMKKWEMLNRMKLMDIVEQEKIEREEKRRKKMKDYATLLNEQIKGNKEIAAKQKAVDAAFNNFSEADEKFLKYGEEIVQQQKAAGKLTYPMEYTMMKYKKQNGLIPYKLTKPDSETKDENEKSRSQELHVKICPLDDTSEIIKCFCYKSSTE